MAKNLKVSGDGLGESFAIAICVCTYKRPEMLQRLLPMIIEQVNAASGITARLFVIDNDAEESARTVVNLLRGTYPDLACKYIVAKTPGAGHARNAAFSEVTEGEALVFFDDDQMPHAEWFNSLMTRHKECPADMLVGPVFPVLPAHAPAWCEGAWAWGQRDFPDRHARSDAGFGNILLPPDSLRSPLCHVPNELAIGLGEDTVVTTRLVGAGFALRQVAGAIAYEEVADERLTVEWVTERFYRSGLAWVHAMQLHRSSWVRIYLSFLKQFAGAVGMQCLATISQKQINDVQARARWARVRGYVDALMAT